MPIIEIIDYFDCATNQEIIELLDLLLAIELGDQDEIRY